MDFLCGANGLALDHLPRRGGLSCARALAGILEKRRRVSCEPGDFFRMGAG
jgi:hypothetical protein